MVGLFQLLYIGFGNSDYHNLVTLLQSAGSAFHQLSYSSVFRYWSDEQNFQNKSIAEFHEIDDLFASFVYGLLKILLEYMDEKLSSINYIIVWKFFK